MRKYEVTIQETVTQVWVLEAEDEQAAEYFYDSGTLIFEKENKFEVHSVEEIDGNGTKQDI